MLCIFKTKSLAVSKKKKKKSKIISGILLCSFVFNTFSKYTKKLLFKSTYIIF